MEMRAGQLPGTVDGSGMSNVEVRWGVTDRGGKPEPTGDGIRKSVPGNGSRRVVGCLAPGVRTPELDAVAEPLLHVDQKARILGAGSISYFPDTPEVPVHPQIRAGRIRWPQVTRGGSASGSPYRHRRPGTSCERRGIRYSPLTPSPWR